MRGDNLTGSLAFAAVAALAAVPWTLVMVPILWPASTVSAYALALAVLYPLWIAPTWRRGFVAAVLAGCLAAVVGVAAPGLSEAILGAALIVAVVRSGFLYRSNPARALVLEGTLLVTGLLFARALASSTPLGVGLGVWAFFLCQSLFFVASGVCERVAEEPAVDPFVGARKKALALLEER
ncbi:MAG: hypothetical protein V3T72_07030 [Thermoanaerobaculia bacterium]